MTYQDQLLEGSKQNVLSLGSEQHRDYKKHFPKVPNLSPISSYVVNKCAWILQYFFPAQYLSLETVMKIRFG